MRLRHRSHALALAILATAASLATSAAHACGGCFHPENQAETTVVTGHRMALAISPAQTVLWDQVQYAGNPEEFAWVLPVKSGAVIEVANDAWFETLDAATETRVMPPFLACQQANFGTLNEGSDGVGCGCGAMAQEDASTMAAGRAETQPPAVEVIHEGTVGPYETVTLKANEPGALTGWLQMHGFAISGGEQPLIDAYTTEGFDFIALRLKPGAGVQQMKPVRVKSPGAVPALPLRMVSAGTGANVALTLFVIGEGRWQTQNFPNAVVSDANLGWDFATSKSNYSGLRAATLAQKNFTTWLTSYAKQGTLLTPATIPNQGQVFYTLSDGSTSSATIADAYFAQGQLDGDAQGCFANADGFASSASEVVDLCDESGMNCADLGQDQIDARNFACGSLDDLAVAFTGMHPRDVWLTRLEANLPHDALATDLVIEATMDQSTVENWKTATKAVNPPCTDATTQAAILAWPASENRSSDGSKPRRMSDLEKIGSLVAVLGLAFARRRTRRGATERSR